MSHSKSLGAKAFDAINVLIMGLITVAMIYPLLHVVALSLSSLSAVELGSITFFPQGIDLEGYKFIIDNPQFWHAYGNTILYVVVGTPINLLLTSLLAYPLAMRDFILRKPLMVFIAITLFFNGGLIPTYLVVQSLGLINTMWAVILPGAVSAFNVIIYRTFFQSIPVELRESAFMDGANDLVILTRIYWPLSKPLLATFALFSIVALWNDWFDPLIYLNSSSLQPIALYLQSIVIQGNLGQWSGSNAATMATNNLLVDPLTIVMAVVVVAMAPVLVLYPFIQRYFARGILIGAIKA